MGSKVNAPGWLKAFLHSFSQVVFVENIFSGILVIAAFAVWAWEIPNAAAGTYSSLMVSNSWNIVILPVLAAIIGNVVAYFFANDKGAIASGLFGFNPVLIGCGAAVFFAGPEAYIVTIIASLLVTPVTTVINNLCSRKGVPGFTLPFIVMTWFFILVSYNTGLFQALGWSLGAPAMHAKGAITQVTETLAASGTFEAAAASTPATLSWVDALTKGFGEVWLLDTVIGSVLIFLAFALDRWKVALKLVVVVLITIGLGMALQVNTGTLNAGVYTYNGILVFMGMETFSKYKDNTPKFWLLVILGLVLAFLLDLALPVFFGQFGLPILTFPFVVATWAILYLEQHLSPDFMKKN